MPSTTRPLVFGLLLASASAQAPGPAAAWEQFQREVGPGWIVQWHPATGTPRAIYGQGLPLPAWDGTTLEAARQHAATQRDRYAQLLGLGQSEFRERIGARMGRTWSFTYDQWFAGLPVLGGRVDVRLHLTGKLVHLGSTAWPIARDFATTPKVAADAAEATAWLAMGTVPDGTPQPGERAATRLVIHAHAADDAIWAPTLAWQVPIRAVDAAGQGPLGSAFVDATTGAFLRFANERHECGLAGCAASASATAPVRPPVPTTVTVRAFLHSAYSPVSAPTNEPLAGVEIGVAGHGTFVTDANGQFTIDLQAATPITAVLNGVHSNLVLGANAPTAAATLQPGVAQTLTFGSAASGEQELAHTTAYHWTWRVNEWARGILGNSPELAAADTVLPTVNIAASCNAYYFGNSINFYASGGGCNNTASASVIAHEWGHGLDDRYGGISQTNGLSEGWGDICSIYLLDDPLIGHDFWSGGGGIRNGNNNQQYPGGSGPHAQGQSWMGFAWKFRQNLRAALGTPQAIAISNDVVLASIAANASNQADAVVAAFQADDNDGMLGNGTPHYAELAAACQAHSLPFPAMVDGYITHTQLGPTRDQLVPRRVEVDAIPFQGQFTQVRVHWLDNGTPRQRNLIPSGTPNRWYGLLPGQPAPNTLFYHVEATHQSGAVFRLPAAAGTEYGAVTSAERRLWADDFESGGAGWTHGATTGTDDWEIGTPAGRTGWGWVDPSSAASGTKCAGNDLGQNGDGAYPASCDTWLRTPPIDCTGFTNIRVRWKRWASCAGPTDRIEVRHGGVPWSSSTTQTVADTGWSTRELLLPYAANQPAVQIEFRLVANGLFPYGGWAIDDVEVYTLDAPVALPATVRFAPEQASLGTQVALQVTNALPLALPFVLALGDGPGPTTVPGIPTMQVGGAIALSFGTTDASGQFTTTFAAPPAPLTGALWYAQVLTLDANLQLATSNPSMVLFTQ
ncbi:MAG: hypothetical protein JNK15_12945 [Planctomycetes bacterium]|nr:hypothetical protein [Planctomycetota bacterium]